MVVNCRTHQLIKTGKNVRISNKFSYSTRNTPFGIKNYAEKHPVPHMEKPRIRLYDCKRFHSSRESRMTLAKLTPQEILSCAVIESRSVGPNPKSANLGILNLILQSQGTSLDQIRDQIIAADGDLQQAVANVNSELDEDLLIIDGDTLRVNPSALQEILTKTVQSAIQSKLPSNSVAATIENNLLENLDAQSSRLEAIAGRFAVPLDVAQRWLEANALNRNKRSLDPKFLDLGLILTDLIGGIIEGQLVSLAVDFLQSVKGVLEGFYIVTAPGNAIGDFLASLINWIVKGSLQVITLIQDGLTNGSLSLTNLGAVRKRRDLEEALAASGEGSGEKGSGEDQGLDLIIRPFYAIVTIVFTPINVIVTGVSDVVLTILQPLLGRIIITRIRALLVAVYNLVFPVYVI